VRLRPLWTFGSGAAVGRLFGRVFAGIMLTAWLSLGAQVRVLLGSRGLLPAADFLEAVHAEPGLSWLDVPTLFRLGCSDGALVAGVVAGALLSVLALAGVGRRVCFALSTVLYLSYVAVGRDFLSFQWDNLLLECGLLAAFLPGDRPAPLVHFLFRVLLFKLYFESGLAKWQSYLHDWQDGSAMTFYYETAPLPTPLAFFAHHLPTWWHHLESRATLVLELLVPFAIFGPRPTRLLAAVAFTGFQILNVATANYGFFCYLALALHLFLFDDRDVERAAAWLAQITSPRVAGLAARLRRIAGAPEAAARAVLTRLPRLVPPMPVVASRWLGRAAAAAYLTLSLAEARLTFAEPGALVTWMGAALEVNARLRLVNTYHLFAAITRERIEPEFQTLPEGTPELQNRSDPGSDATVDTAFVAHDLRHKPGDVRRAPDFVAPHQPRVDFQLWFYGLRFRSREPAYVSTLLERMCEDPPAVQPLFSSPLPPRPAAVRIVYWRYTFATRAEARATSAWWHREQIAQSPTFPCPDAQGFQRKLP
jgi:hypothetical protein